MQVPQGFTELLTVNGMLIGTDIKKALKQSGFSLLVYAQTQTILLLKTLFQLKYTSYRNTTKLFSLTNMDMSIQNELVYGYETYRSCNLLILFRLNYHGFRVEANEKTDHPDQTKAKPLGIQKLKVKLFRELPKLWQSNGVTIY